MKQQKKQTKNIKILFYILFCTHLFVNLQKITQKSSVTQRL